MIRLINSLLLKKLKTYGLHSNCCNWFASYSSDRQQRVQLVDETSDWRTISRGVPQDSILGPLLFLIYINDLIKVSKYTELFLFADDTNVTALNQTTENIAYYLKEISNWLNANKLVVNISKTFKMSKGSSASSCLRQPYSISNSIISATTNCNYLGITIASKLFFSRILIQLWRNSENRVKLYVSLGIMYPENI